MTDQEIDTMGAGLPMDCLIAEFVLGWHRVQAPQFDYDGPLPEQGEVLVSPWMLPQIESGEYKWPPKGVVPLGFFVGGRYSTTIEGAWQVVERLRPAFGFWIDGDSPDGYTVSFQHGMVGTDDYREGRAQAATAALAICRAALRAVRGGEGQ